MTNPFLLVVSAALILLGASAESYWLSYVVALFAIFFEPSFETVLWMIAFILASYWWHTGQKEFLQNEYLITLFLIAGIILLVVAQQIVWAVFLAGVLVLLFFLALPIRSGKKVYGKVRENYVDLKAEVGSAKGQYPKTDVLDRGLKASAGKIGDFAAAKNGSHLRSPNLPQRIYKGAKNLIDDFWKVFK